MKRCSDLRVVSLSGRWTLLVAICLEMSLLIVVTMELFCNLIQVNVSNRVVAVKYARNFLKGRTFGLDVEEPDKN